MSKTFSDAYKLGQSDGEEGENKLPTRAWVRSLTHIGSYLPGAENRDDEWVKGYRQGFEDKVKQVNVKVQPDKEVTMNSNETMSFPNQLPETSPMGGSQGTNAFAYRIAIARNLYEQTTHLRNFLFQTDADFRNLFSQHELLAGEFFNDLLTYHLRPRVQQISELANQVQTQDQPKIQSLVEKYEYAIQGKERGQAAATAYFAHIGLSHADQLSGLSAAIGNGDPRDYDTQLAVAQSVRRIFEGLLSQLDAIGRAYDSCVRDHDELMKQDFDNLLRQNIEPRLQQISDLWRVVRDRDLAGIDDVISRLKTVAAM
jgi:hypothetical protein